MPGGTDRFELYVVSKDRRLGIFDSWALADQQVVGFNGVIYKGFNTKQTAERFMQSAGVTRPKYIVAEPQNKYHLRSTSPLNISTT